MWNSISNKYEVSDKGEIRNKKTKRILHQFVGKDGYLRVQFDGKTKTVHRIVAKSFLKTSKNKLVVNHKDGNKQNNNISNLEWVTSSENQKHAYQNNLKPRLIGIKNGRCKLTNENVEFIKKNYVPFSKIYGAKALSKRFGVAPQTISAIITGQNWKHRLNILNEGSEL